MTARTALQHCCTPLLERAEVRMGCSFRRRLELHPAGDVAVIRMKDIDETHLVHFEGLVRVQMPDLKSHHPVRPADLLFRSRGRTNSAALVSADFGRAVLAAPMLLIRPTTDAVDPSYLQWFINHAATQAGLSSQAAGTAVKMIDAAAVQRGIDQLEKELAEVRMREHLKLLGEEGV